MTFSLIARDPKTGAFGMVVSSSSPAVAARCMHLRAKVGAVASQNVTNPGLGPFILDALDQGRSSSDALSAAHAMESYPEYRQVSVIDSEGKTAHFSGAGSLGNYHWVEAESAVGAGNLLASSQTVEAMVAAYLDSSAIDFEARLLAGFSAALEAGGEVGPVRSAGLQVVENVPWAVTDLRVDDAAEPLTELHRLWDLWKPQKAAYLQRALSPREAPGFHTAGDVQDE